MFDIGFGQVLLIGGVSFVLLGKKDMPLVFRMVGRGVGRVSGLIQGGRARMAELSKGSDLLELQNEIRSNLDDLRVIKSELVGAARLPAGITSSSHPGSRLLKTQHTVSAAPSAPGTLSNALSAYPAFAHSGPHISSVAPANGDAVAGAAPSSALPPPPGLPGVVTGSANVRRMSAGEGIGFPAGGAAALRRVRSAGGDRLQQLAMAEAEYAKNGLYSHKTESFVGGADILMETITNSLLQERYQQVMARAMAEANTPRDTESAASPAPGGAEDTGKEKDPRPS